MAIRISLILAMEISDIHNIIVITNSFSAASKILESKVNPFQSIVLLLATEISSFLSKNARNNIHFWYCPSKAKWPRHKLVNDQVKATNSVPELPSRVFHLFSKKKECNDILCKWQTLFSTNLKKGYYFLNFKDKKQQTIKSTYAKGGLWLLVVGSTNSLCTCFAYMITGHASIREYCQRFFFQSPVSCSCCYEYRVGLQLLLAMV